MAVPKAGVVLKAVKKIVVQFCPFESNVRSTREFLTRVTSGKAGSSNMKCEVSAQVKHDGSQPVIDITFMVYGSPITGTSPVGSGACRLALLTPEGLAASSLHQLSNAALFEGCAVCAAVGKEEYFIKSEAVDGEKLLMKGANLTCAEMLTTLQSKCRAKDPQAKETPRK